MLTGGGMNKKTNLLAVLGIILGVVTGVPTAFGGAFLGFDCLAESQFYLALLTCPLLGCTLGVFGASLGIVWKAVQSESAIALYGAVIGALIFGLPITFFVSAFLARGLSC